MYQKNDTVFKIKLQKGTVRYGKYGDQAKIFGDYYLSVKGVVKENYIKMIPTIWDASISAPSCNIYINAISDTPNYLGFTFYGQCKQHLNGKGIVGGTMNLLSSNNLHWKLDERKDLWYALEGDYTEDMLPSPEEWTPCGLSSYRCDNN